MTYRSLLVSTFALGLALSGPTFAAGDVKNDNNQKSPSATTPSRTAPSTTGSSATNSTMQAQPTASSIQAEELLGADIKNAENETIGEVESVYVDKDGKVRSVIVGVGGFLGMGERNVSVGWNSLTVADGGETVKTNLTKDQLKAMPEYQYSDDTHRGKLFNDNGIYQN